MTAVGVVVAGLVLVAIITVVVIFGTTRHVAVPGGVSVSSDACNVVTPDEATAAFGHPAGPPHYVLGACVYDDGLNDELIVEVVRKGARETFTAGRSSTATDVPGVGDSAYYVDGRLRVLKGTSLMQLVLGPTPSDTPSPKLLALANAAVGRL
ncbi:MAG: hypothetical protein M3083_07765 [Actinomycetota bacterium]|nr:hypothetical protein [Actinomycetota bacterium]